MNQINKAIPVINWGDEPTERIQTSTHELKDYSSEGSEFLNDAIRMVEQPLKRTEEGIAPGSPNGLL